MKPAVLPTSAVHHFCRSTARTPARARQTRLPDKSGKKVPTAVQKVYLRLGKKVHELTNNLFISASLPRRRPEMTPTLVTNVLIP